MDAAPVVENRLRRIARVEQLADRIRSRRALGAVAEEHGGDGGIELIEMLEYLFVRDPLRAGNRAVAVEVLEPRVDEPVAPLEVLDQLELAHRPHPRRELDRLHRAPGRVHLEPAVAEWARQLACLLALR